MLTPCMSVPARFSTLPNPAPRLPFAPGKESHPALANQKILHMTFLSVPAPFYKNPFILKSFSDLLSIS